MPSAVSGGLDIPAMGIGSLAKALPSHAGSPDRRFREDEQSRDRPFHGSPATSPSADESTDMAIGRLGAKVAFHAGSSPICSSLRMRHVS